MTLRQQFSSKRYMRTSPQRFGGVMTPYQWMSKGANGWRIGFGASSFLVAEGSGFSRAEGMRLFRKLEGEWLKRPKKNRKVKT